MTQGYRIQRPRGDTRIQRYRTYRIQEYRIQRHRGDTQIQKYRTYRIYIIQDTGIHR